MFEDLTAPPTTPTGAVERPRRTRRTAALRAFVRETSLSVRDFIHPLFLVEGTGVERPIETMPGHAQLSVDKLAREVAELRTLGVPAVLLFGIPKAKDAIGSGAWDPDGPVPRAIRELKRLAPDLLVIADVCLCEYTAHGHCGVVRDESGVVINDETLPLLGQAAVCYAQAGADIVAPSAMMDGQVAAIRVALDDAGLTETPILSYAAKHASAFYGPFRGAAESTPSFGDRRAYQMDPANAREALREVQLDVDEGADLLMVKPAGSALDIILQVRQHFPHPLVAYQVSGEYAMLKAAAQRGWLDEPRAALESLIAIRRAGADRIITYYAKEAARWLSTAG
jgi:porphobilinogen synthase